MNIWGILFIIILVVLSVVVMNAISPVFSASNEYYACTGPPIACGPEANSFGSIIKTGHVTAVDTFNGTKFDPYEGVFGNSMAIYGYKNQYFTIPNNQVLNPETFSVSFWIKQDPKYLSNSKIISHTNAGNTAGWSFGLNVTKSQKLIQFSVTNADGKIFAVSTPFDTGFFQNVVGTFNGKQLKIYLNSLLVDTTELQGKYSPDPSRPLNVGLNSYSFGGSWTGQIDELRIYNKAISESDIEKLSDYDSYLQESQTSSEDIRLVGYWPLNGLTMDKSKNHNNGTVIHPIVSMAFSPDERLFFSVRDSGEIRVMKPIGQTLQEPFARLQDPITNETDEILGIALDPSFPTNHYVYAYVEAKASDKGSSFGRVVRFVESENKASLQNTLVDNIPVGKEGRFGGALTFGPDDKLYVTTPYTDQLTGEQNMNLSGKVLRINRDGTIPTDNPSPNSPLFTEGHRNMFGIAFDLTRNDVSHSLVSENDPNYFDEINVLESGGDYGFPSKLALSQSDAKARQTDNSTSKKPARIYYTTITPTQIVYYDEKRYRDIRGMFLVTSYGQKSIYALSLNSLGQIDKEIVIRLPEIPGHIISIAKAPNGEIYVAGENIYKLTSIGGDPTTLTYFVNVVKNYDDIQINDLTVDLDSKVLSINLSRSLGTVVDSPSPGNENATQPSLEITVPKALLGSIYSVTSKKYNETSDIADKVIESFNTRETRRVTNVGDTVVNIQLNENVITDNILLKGQTSALIRSPTTNIRVG